MHYYTGGTYGDKRLVSLYVRGVSLEFLTYTSLFAGSEVDLGTRLLLEYMDVPKEGSVLDVGCGYGVIGITLAKLNPSLRVYMVDVNPIAVKVSKYNAKLNGVEERVEVVKGDAYVPFKHMCFKAIYSNPPLSAGRAVVENIVLNAKEHLDKEGFAQFVLAKGGEYIVSKAKEKYSTVEYVSKKGYILLTLKP